VGVDNSSVGRDGISVGTIESVLQERESNMKIRMRYGIFFVSTSGKIS
jgi:hypothetical protein